MNIDYSICKDISSETLDTGRTYFTPNGDYPSVTTILDATADKLWLERWKQSLIKKLGSEDLALQEMKEISKTATDRGELVHSYMEKYWSGENVFSTLSKESSDVISMTTNLINATVKNIGEVFTQEVALWNDLLGYAGRVDMVAEWRGIPSIIDFKTSKKKKYKSGIKDYYIQCTAYAEAHNELFGTNIENLVILITTETGSVQGFYGKRINYISDLKYRINQYYKMLQK